MDALTANLAASTLASEPEEAATARVLGVTELAENTLLHLPFVDLLKFQQVNKHFKQLIEDSPALQQKLFLAPAPVDTPDTRIPVLPKHFKHRNETYHVNFLKTAGDFNAEPSNSSWKRLLQVQPPVHTAELGRYCVFCNDTHQTRTLSNEVGITLGELTKALSDVRKEIKEDPDAFCER